MSYKSGTIPIDLANRGPYTVFEIVEKLIESRKGGCQKKALRVVNGGKKIVLETGSEVGNEGAKLGIV
jgi:hypothetical protein